MSRRNTLFSNSISFAALAVCICLANDGGFAAHTAAQDFVRYALSQPRMEAARESTAPASEEMLASSAIRFLPPASTRLNYLISNN